MGISALRRLTPWFLPRKVSPVLRRIGHLLVVTALLAAVGGHWAMLQSIAWTTMLADNLRDGNMTEAVSKTFDGEHPCPLCKHIAEGKKSEKKSDALDLKVKKLEFATELKGFVFAAPASFHLLPLFVSTADSQTEAPPVPPPRCFAA